MSVDVSKLQFYSGYPIDKITQQDTVTYTVAAGVPSISPDTYPSSLQSVPNTLGQKAFVTASWAIDGTNFISSLEQLQYFSATFMQPLQKAFINCGVDGSNVYFYLVNNFTSSITFTINYAVDSIS